MEIDIRSIILNQAITYLLCTVVMALLWQQNRHRFKGLTCWLGDFAMQTLALTLLALRGTIPVWFSIIVGNALMVGGLILFYNGLERFFGYRSNPLRHGVLLAGFVVIHAYFTFVQLDLAARNINISLATLLIFLQCLWLVKQLERIKFSILKWSKVLFIGFCVVSVLRILVNLILYPQGDFLTNKILGELLLFIAYQGLIFASVFIILLMINQRLFWELEQQKHALEVTESNYRQLVELSPDAIAVYQNNTIVFANHAAAKLLNATTPAELVGRSVFDFLHPDYIALGLERTTRTLKTGEISPPLEEKLLCLNGEVVDVEVTTGRLEYQGMPALQTIARDITQRKHIEAQIQAYQQQLEVQNLELRKLSRAIEQSANAIMITDAEGVITYVNPAFTRITGYTAAEVLGQTPRILKSGLHGPEVYQSLWSTIRRGETWHGELINRKKNGELYYEETTISPVKDNAGAISYFIAIKDDITARKHAEETLRENEEALRRYAEQLATQNAELDAFAHTVAHDLKNPIGLIVGYSELLQEQEQEWSLTSEQRQMALQVITQTGRKVNSILEELMLLSGLRQQTITPSPVDVLNVAQEALKRLLDQIAQRQATIMIHTETPWPTALGYSPWIEEIWINYLSNALKYGGTPPHIEIGWDWVAEVEDEGKTQKEAAPVSTVIPHPSSFVRFWVRDNGPGLTPKAQAQLFMPFTRLDQIRAQGHGLGLSIVQRIAEKLGGRVGVHSTPGEGSTFFFELPAAPEMSSACAMPTLVKPEKIETPPPRPRPPTAEGLKAEWLAAVQRAAIECDARTITVLSTALPPEQAAIAQFLELCAANFDYETILEWLAATQLPA